MTKNKTKLCSFLVMSIGLSTVYAQQASTASGGNSSGSGGSVAYSVGQIVYTTNTGTTGSVAQGVQQPYEISIATGLDEVKVNLHVFVYPNPTSNHLLLQVDNSSALSIPSLLYQIYDMNGRLLESNPLVGSFTTIKMEQYPTATYFLKVIESNKEVKTFKIVKN
jgi:hypothetical protein